MKYYYKWPKMRQDIKKYVQKCTKCQFNKPSPQLKPKMVVTNTPCKSFDLITIDTVGPLQTSPEGFKYILTMQCELTKFVIAGPVKSKNANDIAKGLFEHFIYLHGFPKNIRSDKGTEYVNEIFNELTKICGIEHKTSTSYHPETIGGLERNHRVLNEFLRAYIDETFTNWVDLLKFYVFSWNSTPNYSIGNYTPYELVYSFKPNLPDFLIQAKIDPLYNLENYAKEMKFKLQTSLARARKFLNDTKSQRVIKFNESIDEVKIKEGDLVKVRVEARNKFDPWFKGPFKVVSIDYPNCTVKINDKQEMTIHLSKVKKFNA